MRIVMTMLVTLFSISCSRAGNSLSMTQAIALACKSSATAIKAKAEWEAAQWQYRSYKADLLPSLTLSLIPMQYNNDVTRRYISETDRDEYRTQQSLYASTTLNLSQVIPFTGGSLYATSELGFLRNFGTTTYNQYSSTPIRVGYSQSIVGYNAFRWSKHIEPLRLQEAELSYRQTINGIAEEAGVLYLEAVMAQEAETLAQLNAQRADTLLAIGKARYQNGDLLRSDLLTLRMTQIETHNDVLKTHNATTKALRALCVIMDMEFDDGIHLEKVPGDSLNVIYTVEAVAESRLSNPSIIEAERLVMEAKSAYDKAKRQRYIESNVDFSFGFNQYADNFKGAYRRPMQQGIVSLAVTIPLIDWGKRKGNLQTAAGNLKAAAAEVELRQRQLEMEVSVAVSDYNTQLLLLQSAMQAEEVSDEVYNEAVAEFKAGASSIEVLGNALLQNKEAHIRSATSLRDCWTKKLHINKLINIKKNYY